MNRQHIVRLPDIERLHLETLIHSGQAPARTQTRARILLLTDQRQGTKRPDRQIAEALLCSLGTVQNVRRRYGQGGLDTALYDQARLGRAPKITGDLEAQLTVLACSDPPQGQARWTVRLLAGRMVELGLVESLSHDTVWQRLKKTSSSPGK